MTSTNGRGERVALYARVSRKEQAEGYSPDTQINELHERVARDGRHVVREVQDPGRKRDQLDSAGLREIRELAESGQIDEVWAWAWDRFGESPYSELLALEFEEYGVDLRALDDSGEGEDRDLLRAIRG